MPLSKPLPVLVQVAQIEDGLWSTFGGDDIVLLSGACQTRDMASSSRESGYSSISAQLR